MDDAVVEQVASRLSKISGQINGIRRMIAQRRYCVDILDQISAAQGALDKVAQAVMHQHLESCVRQAFASGSGRERAQKIKELMTLFKRFEK